MTPEEEDRAEAFIGQVSHRFTTAKTVPQAPHQYLARAWLIPEQQTEFDWLADLIGRVGYTGQFWDATWKYIDLPPQKYWVSRSWYGEDAGQARRMLNRAKLEVQRWEASTPVRSVPRRLRAAPPDRYLSPGDATA